MWFLFIGLLLAARFKLVILKLGVALNISGYKLLDFGHQRKLEQVGPCKIIRPAPQALSKPLLSSKDWRSADFEFKRDKGGTGLWSKLSKSQDIGFEWLLEKECSLKIKLTDFGHIGVFPEHGIVFNDKVLSRLPKEELKNLSVLHLFAHTGLLSLILAKYGAKVTHVDASPKSISWAKENQKLCKLSESSIRWIVEDVRKFVAKEVRRGVKYQGIILDPPSFGRGSKREVWKIEEHLSLLLTDLSKLLAHNAKFVFLTNHTPGVTGCVLENLLKESFSIESGELFSGEMKIPVVSSKKCLASGFFAAISKN